MAVLEPTPPTRRQEAEAWQQDRVLLDTPPGLMTGDQFFDFCRANADLRIERAADGRLIIMPPPGIDTGGRNADITTDLTLWNRKTKLGKVIDSSGIYTLPNGAKRGPDASWIENSRWEALEPADRKKFAHVCPDFVVELRSETDRLPPLQEKMREYMENGARLGWLIDPQSRRVEVYRPGQDVQVLEDPRAVSGDPELPGFTLELTPLW